MLTGDSLLKTTSHSTVEQMKKQENELKRIMKSTNVFEMSLNFIFFKNGIVRTVIVF
jgi:hypothetical protein